jgi:outer membrane protein assembly factor BamB
VHALFGQERTLHDVTLPGENRQVAPRFAAAQKLVQVEWTPASIATIAVQLGSPSPLASLQVATVLGMEGNTLERWSEALDVYQRLIDTAGDDLVTLSSEGGGAWARSLTVRRLCHERIAAAPPSVVRLYRQRVDGTAEKLLRQGLDAGNVKPLRRLVDEFFCSRFSGQALDLLGDIAFEKGHFDEAISWWRLIPWPSVRWAESRPTMSSAPASLGLEDSAHSTVDMARVKAKQMIAGLFQGDRDGFVVQLQSFEREHAGAKGFLAGRTGNYATILRSVLAQLPPDAHEEDWSTFGGHPSRNRVAMSAPSPRLWADGPTWRVRLGPEREAGEPDPLLPTPQTARRLACHPVIVRDKVLVADARSVSAHALRTGQVLFRYDLKAAGHDDGVDLTAERWPPPPDARFTLSVDGDRAFVRLGRVAFAPRKEQPRGEEINSFLICLDMSEAAREREVWSVVARGPVGAAVMFEGAPLVHDGQVYIALSHVLGRRTQTSIACYHARTGSLRWSREVCEADEFDEPPVPRTQHNLLTLAGPNIVYASHSGAVVALDAASGQRIWAMRYLTSPAASPPGELQARGAVTQPRSPEAGPCVFADQRLYVAPQDTNRLFCLDPAMGRVLWERDGLDVVHLLGVNAGRLFFTTTQGLRAVRADNGLDQGGWARPDEGRLATFGRGLLAGASILWPTQDALLPVRAVSQTDGLQGAGLALDPTQFRRLNPGNFAWAHGCLMVADGEYLSAYLFPRNAAR